MYHKSNKFIVTIHDYDATVAISVFQMMHKYHAYARKILTPEICPSCTKVHICSLHKWLKAFHADPKVPSLRQDMDVEESDDNTLARRTFGVVSGTRKKPWKEVEEVLGAFFRCDSQLRRRNGRTLR